VATTDSFCNPTISSPSLNHGARPVVAYPPKKFVSNDKSYRLFTSHLPHRVHLPYLHVDLSCIPRFWEYSKILPFSAEIVPLVRISRIPSRLEFSIRTLQYSTVLVPAPALRTLEREILSRDPYLPIRAGVMRSACVTPRRPSLGKSVSLLCGAQLPPHRHPC
jgi:hypothetical protein